MSEGRSRARLGAALLLLSLALTARAGEPEVIEVAAPPRSPLASSAWLLAGAATGLVAHEGCHLVANLALGNRPRVARVTFAGVIPFFAISPDLHCYGGRCVRRDGTPFGRGPAGVFVIESAGLQCQHLGSELLLTHEPDLRHADAPFRNGMLALNVLLSLGYVAADLAGLEPAGGDLRGLHHDAGAPRQAVNALVAGAALLDAARWIWPEVAWLRWASRSVKVGFGGVALVL